MLNWIKRKQEPDYKRMYFALKEQHEKATQSNIELHSEHLKIIGRMKAENKLLTKRIDDITDLFNYLNTEDESINVEIPPFMAGGEIPFTVRSGDETRVYHIDNPSNTQQGFFGERWSSRGSKDS